MGGLIGIFAAFAVIILGALSDGDPLSSLFSLTALIIVFGGTFAALLTQFGFAHLLAGLTKIKWVVKPPKTDLRAFVDKAAEWSNIARSQGTLALEGQLDGVTDHFQRQGLQMIVDNTPPDDLASMLTTLAENAGREDSVGGELWEAAGGYTPTIGVMGAVLGLIHVMMRLDHPEELGAGVATAFVATIYGVGAANLLFLPLGTRLASIAEALERERHVMIQGFLLISEGKSGVLIRQNLQSFLPENTAKKVVAEAAAEPAEMPAAEAA